MGNRSRAKEAALVRAVRALDQGSADAIPDRLRPVWDILEDYSGGSFHAAEEMLLRWLLKNMTGSSSNAERVRRYPLAWDILGAVFPLIPLFSLAKSLADRRFVAILQQTLKEVAAPQEEGGQTNGAGSDVDMADAPAADSPVNPRKRKRAEAVSFDVTVQRQVPGCLQTAEAVFEAVRVLLSRCEIDPSLPPMDRMGAEHVKSLFWSSAVDSMGILVPWLTICGLALDNPKTEPLREQTSWLSTFAAIWELHLRNTGDASEVATHLSGMATRLLGKLKGIPQRTHVGAETAIHERWARDLSRFLMRNLILPARAAFLTQGSQDVMRIGVDMSSPSAQITFPVLFDLVTKYPLQPGSTISKKDHEAWIQAVFGAIVHAAKNVSRGNRPVAIRAVMELAAERGAALSAASLRAVCKDYAFRQEGHDWGLIHAIVKLNPDVFLITEDGQQLLEQILEQTRQTDSLDAEDSSRVVQFNVSLAEGYAQGRDLSTFIKLWLKNLAPAKPKAGLQPLWAQKELADTVARLVQTSLNTNQLVEILDWLSSQTQSTEGMARIHILDAISGGISQEEYVDAVNMKLFEGTFLEKFSKKELPAISACRWMVASKSIAKGTLEEAGRVWSQIRSDIKSTLRKSPIEREDTLAAFKCCAAAWLANYSGGTHEDDTATLICSFVERLEKDSEPMELDSDASGLSVNKETYFSWIISVAPRLLSLLVAKNGSIPTGFLTLLTVPETEDAARVDSALAASRRLLECESIANNQKLMDLLIDEVISMIDTSKAGRSKAQTTVAMQFLLDVPAELLSRAQREAAMKSLVTHLPGVSDKAEAIGTEYWKLALSLMVKLMGRPTFYEGMSFAHLESVGRCLLKIHKRSNRRSRGALPSDEVSRDRNNFKLLQHLAVLAVRQMTSGSPEAREKAYLKDAITLLRSPCQDSDVVPRIVLLQAFVSTVQTSSGAKKLEEDGLEFASLKDQLLQVVSPVVTSGKRTGKGLLALILAIEALSVLDNQVVRQAVSGAVPSLLETSNSLLENGVQDGWEVRIFLANHFPEALASPLNIKVSAGTSTSSGDGEAEDSESTAGLGKAALLRYVDAVVRSADEDTKFGYLKELLLGDGDGQDDLSRLSIVYRLIQHLKGSQLPESLEKFDLARAHTALCRSLKRITTPAPFLLTAKTIHLLLGQNPACMIQWNIDLTLSTVCVLSNKPSTQAHVAESPSIYPALCSLVEIIIKRHRKRLDGHFHILLPALKSLLRLLLSRPRDSSSITTTTTSPSSSSPSSPEKHARLFSRLLTLLCEPTVASVSRAQTTGLDSEKDRAKRYAGQFMYIVLMQYIKLQLEFVVPLAVREALEPGVYSILDITTPGGLKIMNDAMDAGGRVVFREVWKVYQREGKWSGV